MVAATENIAPSTKMNAEVQDVCPKIATQRRIRRIMAVGQSAGQSQLRACQPVIPAPRLQTAHQVSTSAPFDVSHVVHRLVARPMTKITAMAAPVASLRREIQADTA
jgi:hypothetical protein